MLWELGEGAAAVLEPIGKWLPKWLQCGCEARRRWLNELGEKWWQRLNPTGHSRFLSRFRGLIMLRLDAKVTPESQLHALLHRTGIRVSLRTMRRWMKALPVKTIPGKETLYGLPYTM